MLTKYDIQELYKLSSSFSRKMMLINIKNLFRKEKVEEAHWLDDKNWWHIPYKED